MKRSLYITVFDDGCKSKALLKTIRLSGLNPKPRSDEVKSSVSWYDIILVLCAIPSYLTIFNRHIAL